MATRKSLSRLQAPLDASAALDYAVKGYIDTADATKVPTSRTITAGTGLTGGGSLAADRTLAVTYGTTAGTACQGNDARLGVTSSVPVTLTDAATITTDASLSGYFRVTLAGNRTLGNPTNPVDGQRVVWEFLQDATGSRTLTLGSAFALGTDIAAVTLTTTAAKRDLLGCIYHATAAKWLVVALARGF